MPQMRSGAIVSDAQPRRVCEGLFRPITSQADPTRRRKDDAWAIWHLSGDTYCLSGLPNPCGRPCGQPCLWSYCWGWIEASLLRSGPGGARVGPAGFEPTTSCPPDKRSTKLSHGPCIPEDNPRDLECLSPGVGRARPETSAAAAPSAKGGFQTGGQGVHLLLGEPGVWMEGSEEPGGMEWSRTVSALPRLSSSKPKPHSDQFPLARSRATSGQISQEKGATVEYQGHTVSLE
jgi:hypothetical protein